MQIMCYGDGRSGIRTARGSAYEKPIARSADVNAIVNGRVATGGLETYRILCIV